MQQIEYLIARIRSEFLSVRAAEKLLRVSQPYAWADLVDAAVAAHMNGLHMELASSAVAKLHVNNQIRECVARLRQEADRGVA